MDSPELYIAQMESQGHTIIGMTNRPCYFKQGMSHVNHCGKIRLALGLHPLQLEHADEDLKDFEKFVDKTSYIGEIGLDFSPEGRSTFDKQIYCFEKILRLLIGKNKILSVHSRQAEKTVLDILDLFYQENVIFHWYSGRCDLIPEIIDHGYYFSINEAMFLSEHGREIISKIPKERVLTESDAPYNRKSDISHTVICLAELWNIRKEDVIRLVNNNFKELLSSISK
jgi:TatD DNase family protein